MLSSEGGDWGRMVPGVSASLISEGVRGLLALLVLRSCPWVGLHVDSGLVMHSARGQCTVHVNGGYNLQIKRLM